MYVLPLNTEATPAPVPAPMGLPAYARWPARMQRQRAPVNPPDTAVAYAPRGAPKLEKFECEFRYVRV